jgi:hypothetical protein
MEVIGRKLSGSTTATYSGSTPSASSCARAAASTAAGSVAPAATAARAASNARLRPSARGRSSAVRYALRLDMARPSGSRTVSQPSMRTGMSRSRTNRRITASC